ncbi:DUF4325 domain-containing protein [Candidatus Gottesmanbacteria bacterium]|nr:DUF4325 domain-containing protein [Candidatus Gottesmanbacteria bacterium]
MIIKLHKFGEILISRPSGREAYLSAKAYLLDKKISLVEFDFAKVRVLSPSWIDEFVTLLKKDYPGIKIIFRKTGNPSVVESIKILKSTTLFF